MKVTFTYQSNVDIDVIADVRQQRDSFGTGDSTTTYEVNILLTQVDGEDYTIKKHHIYGIEQQAIQEFKEL